LPLQDLVLFYCKTSLALVVLAFVIGPPSPSDSLSWSSPHQLATAVGNNVLFSPIWG